MINTIPVVPSVQLQQLIKNEFEYIPETGELFRKSFTSRGRTFPRRIINNNVPSKWGYIKTFIRLNDSCFTVMAHHIVWFLCNGCWPDNEIDHCDNDTTNNNINNLRIADRTKNNSNKPKYSTYCGKVPSSIYKGVSFFKDRGKWGASIKYNKKQKHLGFYDTEFEAALVYDAAAVEIYKDFANVNFQFPILFQALNELNDLLNLIITGP